MVARVFLTQLKASCPFAWGSFPMGLRHISFSSVLLKNLQKQQVKVPV